MVRPRIVKQIILTERNHAECAAWAIIAITVPTALRLMIDGGANGMPFVTYYPAVLIASLLLGWRYASIVAIGSAIAVNWLFLRLPNLLETDASQIVLIGLFFLSCALLISMGEALRRTLYEVQRSAGIEAAMAQELRHRLRNLLSVVQATAALTMRSSGPENFMPAFTGRIIALSRANDLVGLGELKACAMADLVDHIIEPYAIGQSIDSHGVVAYLPEECCVPTALALHELSTNSLKYGALSVPAGQVSIVWAWIDQNLLRLTWTESGGPAVTRPDTRGFGTMLLTSQPTLRDVEIFYDPAGVSCFIHIEALPPT